MNAAPAPAPAPPANNVTIFGDVELAVQLFLFGLGKKWIIEQKLRENLLTTNTRADELQQVNADLTNTPVEQGMRVFELFDRQEQLVREIDNLETDAAALNIELDAINNEIVLLEIDSKAHIDRLIARRVKGTNNPFFTNQRRSIRGVTSICAAYFMNHWRSEYAPQNRIWQCNRSIRAKEYAEVERLALAASLTIGFRGQLEAAGAAGADQELVDGGAAGAVQEMVDELLYNF